MQKTLSRYMGPMPSPNVARLKAMAPGNEETKTKTKTLICDSTKIHPVRNLFHCKTLSNYSYSILQIFIVVQKDTRIELHTF